MIYCVEDDASIREIEIYTLHSTGFEAAGFENGAAFFAALKEKKPELIILDIMLPDEDGTEILRKLKKDPSTRNIPVIMASAKGTEYDKVQGLDIGADDYLAKPFHLMELSARIRSVARRSMVGGRKGFTLGNVYLDPESSRVEIDGCDVALLKKEFAILAYFMQRPEHLVDKTVLAEAVWGDHVDQADNFHFLYAQVKNLRRKLEDAGANIELKAVYGFGYKLVFPEDN